MKSLQSPIKALLLLIPACGLLCADEQSAASSESSSVKKSVTVTSDGNQTIKKTTITENGKTQTITEITDANGKTRIIEEGDEKNPKDHSESKVWLGLKPRKASAALRGQLELKENEGLVVEVIAPDGPASKAGIRVNDLLLSLDEESSGTPDELEARLHRKKAGETVNLEVMRKGQRKTIGVTLENQPKGRQADPNKRQQKGKGNQAFEEILSDPNVPESFKEKVREMQRRQKEFMDKHKINMNKLPNDGNNQSSGKAEVHSESSAESDSDGGKAFDGILSNSNLPENFKERIKEMQRRHQEQMKKRKVD